MEIVEEIQSPVRASRDEIIRFMREIVAIPSMDGQLKEVGERIIAEMNKLGFDEARFDKMGNVVGRMGSGGRVIVYGVLCAFSSHVERASLKSHRRAR